jgi:hypothetical protein
MNLREGAGRQGMNGVVNHDVHVRTKKSPSGDTGLRFMFREEQKEAILCRIARIGDN